MESAWKSSAIFESEMELEKPQSGRPLGHSSLYHPTQIVLSHERSPDRFVVALNEPQPTGDQFSITGQFVVPAGQKITSVLDGSSGGRIFLQRAGYRLNASMSVGHDGKFRYLVRDVENVLHPGTVAFVCPTLDGFSQRSYGPIKVNRLPIDLGTFNLEAGFTLTIKVQDPQGRPVPGAVVQSAELALRDGATRQTKTILGLAGITSNSRGLLVLKHVSSAPITLTLATPGFALSQRDIAPEQKVTIPWTLVPMADVTGRFVDVAGKGVEGVEVHLVRSDSQDTPYPDPRDAFLRDPDRSRTDRAPLTTSDSEGRFRIHTLAASTRHWLMALHADHRPAIVSVSESRQLDPITLQKPITISGIIRGDLRQLASRGDRRYVRYNNIRKTDGHTSVTGFHADVDPNGRFEITQLFPGPVGFRLPMSDGSRKTLMLNVSESVSDLELNLE